MAEKRTQIIRTSYVGPKAVHDKFGAVLTWNEAQMARRNGNFVKAQVFMDSEILRLSEPYTPKLTGQLIRSANFGTVIGSGLVIWKSPYAARQYYSTKPIGRETGPLRGYRWFARMKADRGAEIIRGVKKIAGRG